MVRHACADFDLLLSTLRFNLTKDFDVPTAFTHLTRYLLVLVVEADRAERLSLLGGFPRLRAQFECLLVIAGGAQFGSFATARHLGRRRVEEV